MRYEIARVSWIISLAWPLAFGACKSVSNIDDSEVSATAKTDCGVLYIKDFSKWIGKNFGQAEIKEAFGCLSRGEPSVSRQQNLLIDQSGNLTIKIAKGQVSVDGSGVHVDIPVRAAPEYTLEYQVLFDGGNGKPYDWTKGGGKLPGMAGGAPYSGGVQASAGDGFSARFMFGGGGKIFGYFYHADMPSKYGDPMGINKEKALLNGQWNKVRVYYRMNKGTQKDGIVRIWVNDQLVGERTDMRFRLDSGMIDSLMFSVFHGGQEDYYRPKQDQFIKFKEFRLTPGSAQ